MAAWGRHDVDGVLALVAEDIEWHYHVGSPPVHGAAAMRSFLDKLKQHQRESRWRLIRSAESGDSVFIEAVEDYLNPNGHRVQVPYAGVYQINEGRISHWRDYVDLGSLMKAEKGEQPPDGIRSLLDARPVDKG